MNDTTTPEDDARYSIGELAELGGVSRRTVRYYVQRELLEPPLGAGRGAYYTSEHLDRLVRIRELQEGGTPLDDIGVILDGRPVAPAVPDLAAPGPRPSAWIRLELAEGVELNLRDRRVTSAQAAALAAAVGEVLDGARGVTGEDEPAAGRQGGRDDDHS